ncbi:MAG TPA: hypothetical protein PKO06_13655, partial [Candidatus Ozemobacteraceae bacterium]|nr:hypothetical protein [Candidatus Ozemobacteraceae bacterium]
ALTVLLGYFAIGAPRIVPGNTASFEDWSNSVRQCVAWLGAAGIYETIDPARVIEEAMENDNRLGVLARFLGAWYEALGPRAVTVAEVLERANSSFELMNAIREKHPEEAGRALHIGYWLKQQKGRVEGGYRLEAAGKDRLNVALWRVIRISRVNEAECRGWNADADGVTPEMQGMQGMFPVLREENA